MNEEETPFSQVYGLLTGCNKFLEQTSLNLGNNSLIVSSLLCRHALEMLLETYWQINGLEELSTATMSSQLTALKVMHDTSEAKQMSVVWGKLSGFVHGNSYTHKPTPEEIKQCIQDVELLANQMTSS